MAKKYRNVLGLHTKEEQDHALKIARDIHEKAKKDILEHDNRDALLFAKGYLFAINNLAQNEGAMDLVYETDRLMVDLDKAYYEVKPE